MRDIEFLFDFGSPNAYMAHRVLPSIAMRTGATVRYRPVLLGGLFKLTGNQPPMLAFAGVRNKLAFQGVEMQRFVRKHGLAKFRLNPHFPVNTLELMRGAVALEGSDGFMPYVEAIFAAMWEDGQKLDDPEVLRATLAAAGFDAEALQTRRQSPDVKQGLLQATEQAADRGAFGIPTFFVGEEMFFGKDQLGDVEEAAAA